MYYIPGVYAEGAAAAAGNEQRPTPQLGGRPEVYVHPTARQMQKSKDRQIRKVK